MFFYACSGREFSAGIDDGGGATTAATGPGGSGRSGSVGGASSEEGGSALADSGSREASGSDQDAGGASSAGGTTGAGGTMGASGAGGIAGEGGAGGTMGASGAAGAGGGRLLFQENFEDGDTAGWSLAAPNAYTFSVDPGTGANGTSRSLRLTRTVSTLVCCDGFIKEFSPPLRPKRIGWWARSSHTQHAIGNFSLSAPGGENGGIASFYFSGSFMYLIVAGSAPAVPFILDQWYRIELRNIDWQAHTFSYFVDGMQIADALDMRSPEATAVSRIDLYSVGPSGGVAPVVYYDEIELE
jgi:hypothetical protein